MQETSSAGSVTSSLLQSTEWYQGGRGSNLESKYVDVGVFLLMFGYWAGESNCAE